jgi:hypothetical protein
VRRNVDRDATSLLDSGAFVDLVVRLVRAASLASARTFVIAAVVVVLPWST